MGAILSAEDYLDMGWAVHPLHAINGGHCTCKKWCNCISPGKHPRTRHGVKQASTDGKKVSQWQKQWPGANIGIVTGIKSNIVAVDVDLDKGGYQSFVRLCKTYGHDIADTLVADTGGGGLHLIYEAPSVGLKNSQSALAPGIDIRGDGGYIVGAPSDHISGKKYAWRDGLYQPSRMPDALLEAILVSQKKNGSKRGNLQSVINNGSRNDTLFRYAASLRGYGKEFEEILEMVGSANSERCINPLSEDEIIRISRSAATYGKSSHGLLNLYRQELADAGESLKPLTRLVLHTLTIHADGKTLIAFPSQATVAKESGLSDQSVRTHTEIAKCLGWLEITKKARVNGQPGSQCVYKLTYPERRS